MLLVGGCGSSSGTSTTCSQTGTDGGVDAPNPDGDQPSADGEVDEADAGDDQAGADGEVDAPNPGGDQPSADLPGLPIGGQVPDTALTTTSPSGCGTVAWVGPDELIPEGIEVVITEFDLPDEVSVDDSACAGAGPACLGGVSLPCRIRRPAPSACGGTARHRTRSSITRRRDGVLRRARPPATSSTPSLAPQSAFLVIEASEPEEEGASERTVAPRGRLHGRRLHGRREPSTTRQPAV